MELMANDDTGVLEQIEYEFVDYHPFDGIPVYAPYPLRFDHPPHPGSREHRRSIEPYVAALLNAVAPSPNDIEF